MSTLVEKTHSVIHTIEYENIQETDTLDTTDSFEFDNEEMTSITTTTNNNNNNNKTKQSIPFGKKNKKYWLQRYYLFSKFDEGIQMDKGFSCHSTQSFLTRISAKSIYNLIRSL